MPDKNYGPNYRWRMGLIDSGYAALYPSRGGETPAPPPPPPPPPPPTNLYVDAGYVDTGYVTEI